MGTLGRIFVLLNGFAALMFLMWSIALYTNRVNWFTDKAGTKENIGQVNKFAKEFEDRTTGFTAAKLRWERNAITGRPDVSSLLSLETERTARRDFYRDNLNRVTEGKDKDGKAVNLPTLVKILRRLPNNPRFDMASREYYSAGPAGLDSISSYTRKIADGRDQLGVQQKELARLVKVFGGLTLEIFGSPNPRVLGLRDFIKEQDAIDAGAQSGAAYLVPLITERDAQTEIFQERNTTLRDRLGVLEGYLKNRKTSLLQE